MYLFIFGYIIGSDGFSGLVEAVVAVGWKARRLWLLASLGSNLGSASYQLRIEGMFILPSLFFLICKLEMQVSPATFSS